MPAEPISLYFDLEKGAFVELEVVARASLHFSAGLKELAYHYDPSFQFRIELERGDEGSLWLKAFLRWIRGQGFAAPTMMGVATAAGFFFGHVADKIFDEAWDATFHADERKITPAEMDEIARRAARAASSETARQHFELFYREIEHEPTIKGVGLNRSHRVPPKLIVPRSEFPVRGALQAIMRAPGERRRNVERGDFTIIRPVLKEQGGKWRLRGPEGEFSATIADERFYDSILDGTAPVPLAAEIHISADLEKVDERTEAGVWRAVDRKILRVYAINRQPRQQSFLAPPPDQ